MLKMASSFKENNDVFINKSKMMLSKYAEGLEGKVKTRYLEKISAVGIDPLLIPQEKLDPECLPPVEASDLLSYLVLETSYYTNAQFKASRSLQADNQMVSGFISSVLGHLIKNKFVVIAKVQHSQRMNDPHVPVWIITNKERTVYFSSLCGLYGRFG